MELLREMREREPLVTDETSLPPVELKNLIRLIRKGAKDLEQKWKNAIHLTNKAYDVAGFKLPHMSESGAWQQYQQLIGLSVRELAKARGLQGKHSDWRLTEPSDKLEPKTVIPPENLPRQL